LIDWYICLIDNFFWIDLLCLAVQSDVDGDFEKFEEIGDELFCQISEDFFGNTSETKDNVQQGTFIYLLYVYVICILCCMYLLYVSYVSVV